MKTSNKILLLFLILVFSVPLITAFILKDKMDREEYTIEKFESSERVKLVTHTLDSVKVLEVTGWQAGLLNCKIKAADSMRYAYNQYNTGDSLTVYQRGDTLFIRHPYLVSTRQSSKHSYFDIDVYLPGFDHIIADGATARVDSAAQSQSGFRVTLRNGGNVVAN